MNRNTLIGLVVCLGIALVALGYIFFKKDGAPITTIEPGSIQTNETTDNNNGNTSVTDPVPEMPTRTLVDGKNTEYWGIFRDLPAKNGVKAYTSDALGISFNYPENYLLFEGNGQAGGGVGYEYIMVAEEKAVRDALARIYPSEGPPTTSLYFYRETNHEISLEEWLRTKPQSNFNEAYSPMKLTPVTVAGLPALRYHVSGLNEMEYVAFRYEDWIVLAVAGYAGEHTEVDFQTILKSIELDK